MLFAWRIALKTVWSALDWLSEAICHVVSKNIDVARSLKTKRDSVVAQFHQHRHWNQTAQIICLQKAAQAIPWGKWITVIEHIFLLEGPLSEILVHVLLPSVAFVFEQNSRVFRGKQSTQDHFEGHRRDVRLQKAELTWRIPKRCFHQKETPFFSTAHIQTMTPSGVDSSALCSTGSSDNEALNHLMTKAKRHHPIKQCAPPLIWATAREPFLRRRTIKSASESASGNPGPFTFHLRSLLFGAYSGGRLKMLVISLRRLWELAFKFERLELSLPFRPQSYAKGPLWTHKSMITLRFVNKLHFPTKVYPCTPHVAAPVLSFFHLLLHCLLLLREAPLNGRPGWKAKRPWASQKKRSDFSFSCLYAASAMWSLKVLKTWEAPEGSEQSH